MTQEDINLLTLPIEIRLQIYHHLFTGQTLRVRLSPLYFNVLHNQSQINNVQHQTHSPLLNILLSCKQICQEAAPQFYSLIRFRFQQFEAVETTWPLTAVLDTFPTCWPLTQCDIHAAAPSRMERLVQRIYYDGTDIAFIKGLENHFPSLKLLEFDLGWDHIGIDQTSFDRAMKQAIRNREWRHAIKDALEQRFPDGMVRAIFDLQKRGLSTVAGGSADASARHFRVVLHWRLAYRFVEFTGECDLDEWVLHVRDPDGASKNVYDIRQEPMFYEMF